jgi:ATP-binding cassette, subfamily C, bacteriocin exporter
VLSKQLKLGEMVALLSITGSILPSVTRLVISNIQIQEASVAFDRMFEFTSIEKEDLTETTGMVTINEVAFHNVSYRFPGRRQILKNISLQLKKGEMVALLGESGGGKSTLMQLIQKFYLPESGSIQINEIGLQDIGTSTWRDQIGAVPQDVKIFNGNLLYNITLSDQPEDYQRAIKFCEENGLVKYFQEFPQGYSTLLGEEGINISGGRKQIVALARALFRAPQLLLLDEVTSAMDRNTEDFILSILQKIKSKMAILIITHRVKIAQRSDRVYILENGMISTSGSPKELMDSKNFFSESVHEITAT